MNCDHSRLAQLVEHVTVNHSVLGSSPRTGAKLHNPVSLTATLLPEKPPLAQGGFSVVQKLLHIVPLNNMISLDQGGDKHYG